MHEAFHQAQGRGDGCSLLVYDLKLRPQREDIFALQDGTEPILGSGWRDRGKQLQSSNHSSIGRACNISCSCSCFHHCLAANCRVVVSADMTDLSQDVLYSATHPLRGSMLPILVFFSVPSASAACAPCCGTRSQRYLTPQQGPRGAFLDRCSMPWRSGAQ